MVNLTNYTNEPDKLQEAIQLLRENDQRKIIWFYGTGSNGKTTLTTQLFPYRYYRIPDIHKMIRQIYKKDKIFCMHDPEYDEMVSIDDKYQYHRPLLIETNIYPWQYVDNPDHIIITFPNVF